MIGAQSAQMSRKMRTILKASELNLLSLDKQSTNRLVLSMILKMGAFISKPSSNNKRELSISADSDDGHLAKRLRFDGAPSTQCGELAANDDETVVVTSNIEVAPSLSALPDSLLVHVLQYLTPQEEKHLSGCLQTFLAIDCTCRSLHNVLGKDEVWKDVFPVFTAKEFSFNTSARERVFIMAALQRIKHEQKSTFPIILRSLGGKTKKDLEKLLTENFIILFRPSMRINYLHNTE